jgi:PIN domain nuclease of toxin-antitoxin system
MKILLDTQAFLWLITDAPELSKRAKKLFLDANNDLFLSLASIWEMAIK